MSSYEASVWRIPDPLVANKGLVKKVKSGKATALDLAAAGATQLGTASDNYTPCTDNGQNCSNDIYAVSLAGETPSSRITWFQAQQACKNSQKRLPSNAEWQAAVAGSPDGAPCNVSSGVVSLTEPGDSRWLDSNAGPGQPQENEPRITRMTRMGMLSNSLIS